MPTTQTVTNFQRVQVALELDDVHHVYERGDTDVRALRGVDLRVAEGDYVAVEGPSGSGKSTLLNLAGALDTPTSGAVSVAGRRVDDARPDERSRFRCHHVGFVFQDFQLIPTLTARENVRLPLSFHRDGAAPDPTRADDLLDRVGLGDRKDHAPTELSGGERQRVAIARALVNDPDLLLADEPTGNLDTETGARILDLFDDLHRDGRTIVVVTHDAQAAERAQRRVRMEDGRVLTGGTA